MTESPQSVYDFSPEKRRQYAEAMMRRGAERIDLAGAAFRKLYPAAPEEMVKAAVFHVYVDGIDAAMMWLADAERFLRDPSRSLHVGVTWELLNHVYNWHMLETLMPHGRKGLDGLLDDINEFAAAGDTVAVQGAVAAIKEMLDGNETAPQFN